jgi:hypothetical protein
MNHALSYNLTILGEVADAERGVYDGEPHDEAIERWLDDCLDIEVNTTHSVNGGRWIESVTVLRTVGGPDTRITTNGTNEVRVRTAWGTQKAFATIDAPNVAGVLMEAAGFLLNLDEVGA